MVSFSVDSKTLRWSAIGLVVAVVVVFVTDVVFSGAPRGSLRVTMFDVGQGDALLVEAPGGETLLIDGGPDRTIVEHLRRARGFFRKTIDVVMLTHPDADHVSGLGDVMRRYNVGRVMMAGVRHVTPEAERFGAAVDERSLPRVSPIAGQTVRLGDARLFVLSPRRFYDNAVPDVVNETSVVFRLEYKDFSMLFTGDSGAWTEEALLAAHEPLTSDVLKIGHHGSDTSTGPAFLEAVHPSVALISVGAKNRFGHPSLRVLRRLERTGAAIYRTDRDGPITITTDGLTGTITSNRTKKRIVF